MIEAALRTYLIQHTLVNPLIGDRMYPDEAPQTPTYPYVVYRLVDDIPDYCLTEWDGAPSPRIQLEIWGSASATGWTDVRKIRKAIFDALCNPMFTGYWGEFFVQQVIVENIQKIPESPLSGQATAPRGLMMDVIVGYEAVVNN